MEALFESQERTIDEMDTLARQLETEQKLSPQQAQDQILVPFPTDRMKAWAISARISTPRNDDPEITILIEVESVARPEDFPQLL